MAAIGGLSDERDGGTPLRSSGGPNHLPVQRGNQGRGFVGNRHSSTDCQQVAPERRAHHVVAAGDESVQLYAVNTAGKLLCDSDAHFGGCQVL